MTFKTVKEYYQDQWQSAGTSKWRRVSEKVLALERSVAFPEGGGQMGDRGFVEQNGTKIAFLTAQKDVGVGRIVALPNFPILNVDGEVHLHLAETIPCGFCEDKPICVEIDVEYRAMLTRSHTAAHLVVMALKKWFPKIESSIQGCSINVDGGRFDLAIEWTNAELIQDVQSECDRLVDADIPILMTELEGEPECRIWNCCGVAIPCGGTHLSRTAQVGKFILRKKNKGKGLVRVYYDVVGPLA